MIGTLLVMSGGEIVVTLTLAATVVVSAFTLALYTVKP